MRWTWGRGRAAAVSVAGLGLALALPALSVLTMAAQSANVMATETALTAETQDLNGHTQATLTISVTGQDGQPAQGPVVISDNGKQIDGVLLGADGHVTTTLSLAPGAHKASPPAMRATSRIRPPYRRPGPSRRRLQPRRPLPSLLRRPASLSPWPIRNHRHDHYARQCFVADGPDVRDDVLLRFA